MTHVARSIVTSRNCLQQPATGRVQPKIAIFFCFIFYLFITEHTQVTPGLPMLQSSRT